MANPTLNQVLLFFKAYLGIFIEKYSGKKLPYLSACFNDAEYWHPDTFQDYKKKKSCFQCYDATDGTKGSINSLPYIWGVS